jgi:mannose-1-phosphate guanylyltransferase
MRWIAVKALILAGGFATRLRPLSCSRPKILFPLVNKPLLQWTFERLVKSNVSEVILAVSLRTETMFKQRRFPKCGLRVVYSQDPLRKPLGTGGPIKKAEKLIGRDAPFLVLNEDVFADLDYSKILEEHEKNKNAVATIALHDIKDPSRYGVAKLGKNNNIEKFIEKPPRGSAPTNLINAGVYVLSPKVFEYIPEGRAVSIERQIFPKLAEESMLYGHVFQGLWMDIGKPKDYLEINRKMLDMLSPKTEYRFSKNVQIRKPVALGKGVTVGGNATLGPYAVLGRDVAVGHRVQIRNSIIFAGAVISDMVSISGAVVGEDAVIGKGAKINEGCIVSDGAEVGERTNLGSGVSVCPGAKVSKSVLTSKTYAKRRNIVA